MFTYHREACNSHWVALGSSFKLGSLSRFGTQPEISFLGRSPQERMLGVSLFIVPPSQLGGSACPVNLNGPGRGGPGTARAAPGPSAVHSAERSPGVPGPTARSQPRAAEQSRDAARLPAQYAQVPRRILACGVARFGPAQRNASVSSSEGPRACDQ